MSPARWVRWHSFWQWKSRQSSFFSESRYVKSPFTIALHCFFSVRNIYLYYQMFNTYCSCPSLFLLLKHLPCGVGSVKNAAIINEHEKHNTQSAKHTYICNKVKLLSKNACNNFSFRNEKSVINEHARVWFSGCLKALDSLCSHGEQDPLSLNSPADTTNRSSWQVTRLEKHEFRRV